MQTLRKKSPLKYRNEPARFFGDGVVFKAKLIGILEVGEARGDRMCQEALQDLKIAIRAAGEHKQRITIHVTIEGLRLRDEKSGESLYHHPVHKISFIAQDMTDSRAFGYIFGSPDCGHRFFGIKTDKAASQVVLAMRDLFQCVFELKKKEIELAKQHIQNRITAHEHQQIKSSILEHKKNTSLLNEAAAVGVSRTSKEKSPETTANLVDLEQELSSIQRGITQMERITPNDDVPTKNVLDDDPFGDSFTSFSSTTPFNILPPPSAAAKKAKQAAAVSSSSIMPTNTSTSAADVDDEQLSSIIGGKSSAVTPPILQTQQQQSSSLDSWLHSSSAAATFADNDEGKISRPFDDDDNLDPLGKKTYVDKKYFFQDLKNPPKKVLKDLSEPESILFDAHFSPLKRQSEIQSFNLDSLSSARSHSHDDSSSSKAIDPFEEEDFSKIMMDQMDSSSTATLSQKSIILPDTKIIINSSVSDESKPKNEEKSHEYKGYSVDLSADSYSAGGAYSDLKRQGSDSSTKNVFSVDSLSKKLPKPNLFGQRNVKRDSNGINMRRLQESDSLSENEPELPPRLPDSEPPPLPPKNQMSDFSDRNRYSRTTPSSSRDSSSRYDYANKFKSHSSDSPPIIPLPSRKINRADTGGGNSSKSSSRKSNDDDDYMTPNASSHNFDSFPQLPPPPPPQKNTSKLRGLRKSETDPKNLDAPTPPVSAKQPLDSSSANKHTIIPDITLSQLLTLGIDDLAQKLNVPSTKLNTMTLVELTTYLSEFIENAKQSSMAPPSHHPPPIPVRPLETPIDSPVFKVSFDDAVFEAKFDDNFGELHHQHEESASFVANFDNFNQAPASVIPTADRYAVFREIIDQEIHQQQQSFEEQHQESIESNNSNSLEEVQEGGSFEFARTFDSDRNQFESPLDSQMKQSPTPFQNSSASKIDNKITEALSGVKDRYAALRELRNIVLVENLFDKTPKPPLASISDSNLSDDFNDDASSSNQAAFLTAEVADNNSLDNLPTYSVSWANDEVTSESIENQGENQEPLQQLEEEEESTQEKLPKDTPNNTLSNKDDLEIDEYMNKAISELSLDQRISPNIQSKSPLKPDDDVSAKHISPLSQDLQKRSPSTFGDKQQQPSPLPISLAAKKSESPQEQPRVSPMPSEKRDDLLKQQHDDSREKTITPVKAIESSESWAVFDDAQIKTSEKQDAKPPPHGSARADFESGSSDGKHEWKRREKAYHKRWPKQNTSSSSRDVSPWEDGPVNDQRKRHPPSLQMPSHQYHHSTERYARPPAPVRHRKDSIEGEYYDDYERRPPSTSRMKLSKSAVHRSKEILESENLNWYHVPGQQPPDHWYPNEDENSDERVERMARPFDRNAYERSTYGPPYDKREPRSYQGFDRNERRVYDKRSKYYRNYNRPEYESYDPYDMPPTRGKPRKDYDEYEKPFERGTRETRSAREYFYDKDRRSFDSNESYDSAGRMHRMNSGEIYGSYESGRNDYRDRYMQGGGRMSRRNQRSRGAIEDDSDEVYRENSGGSLQRQTARSKHSNIKLDDEVWSSGGGNKYWKQRPASATVGAGDKVSGHSESDEERDSRYRRKQKQGRNKEVELRSNYATIRYSQQQQQSQQQHAHQRRDYYDFEDDLNDFVSDPRQGDGNNSPTPRDYYARKKHSAGNIKAPPPPVATSAASTRTGAGRYSAQSYDDESEEDNFVGGEGRMKKNINFKKSISKDIFIDDSKEHENENQFIKKPLNIRQRGENRPEEHFHHQQQQQPQQEPQGNISNNNNKFPVDGFESDFNSSPKQLQQQQHDQKAADSHKFTFEEREFSISPNSNKNGSTSAAAAASGSASGIQQKLRFNENVSISKFDKNAASSSQQMFEDDFLQSWSPEISGASSSSNVQMQSSLKKTSGSNFARQDNIKKSDSINIFARKVDEDPFANDDFFNTEEEEAHNASKAAREEREDPFQWDNKNNFANFDNDKNI